MQKLIKLLNEYEENRPMELPKQYRWRAVPVFKGGLVAVSEYNDEMVGNSDLLVISKFNGFIKWLVENDNIETNNLSLKAFKNIFSGGGFVEVSDLEVLLMLLAISDTPIDDLISYLK